MLRYSFLLCLAALSMLLRGQARAEALLICGGGEVALIEYSGATKEAPQKLWSWRAKGHAELPENLWKEFGTTDDCKPLEGGKKVLISSSGGGCALVERDSGRVLWFAHVPNAHSLEALPRERVVVASSTHAQGNRLALFDLGRSNQVVGETPFPAAHGVTWDEARRRLWALGEKELRSYSLVDWESEKPSLHLEASYPLPTAEGHDLRAVPESDDLTVSTVGGVYLFDRAKGAFRAHPELGKEQNIKSMDIHPGTKQLVYVQAESPNWWSSALHFLSPGGEVRFPGERLYKARWLESAENE